MRSIKSAAIVFGRSDAGIDWESFGDQAARGCLLMIAATGGGGERKP